MKKIVILIGNYCSGKTEIALNMAVKASGEGLRTLVIDLDRINDYFRMSDQIQTLTDRHIELVSHLRRPGSHPDRHAGGRGLGL